MTTIRISPPFSYKLAKWMQKRNIPGGYKLERTCRSNGWWDVAVKYALKNNVSIIMPFVDNNNVYTDVMNYEHLSVKYISSIIAAWQKPVTLIDCGADIGVMSLRLVSESAHITQAYAFEPNDASFQHLENNYKSLQIQARAYNKAVSDFTGMAELKHPEFDAHAHAAYIVPSKTGGIEVCSIDSLDLKNTTHVLLKVDVEGEELPVIKGAVNTLTRAEKFVVAFEAHHQQVSRTKIDPTAVIHLLNSIKPCRAAVIEHPEKKIDITKPFFEQFESGIYNICVISE